MRLSPVAQLACGLWLHVHNTLILTQLADSQICDHVPKDTVGWVSADLVNNSCLVGGANPQAALRWWWIVTWRWRCFMKMVWDAPPFTFPGSMK